MTSIIYDDLLQEAKTMSSSWNSEVLESGPKLMELLVSLYNDSILTWKDKILIQCCMSYFSIPNDIIPDDNSYGFYDDIFLMSYVINKLLVSNREIVIKYWNDDRNLTEVLNFVSEKTFESIKDKANSILRLVGIIRFEDEIEEKSIFEIMGLGDTIDNHEEKKIGLFNILKTIYLVEGERLQKPNLKALKRLLNNNQMERVIRIMEEIDKYEAKFDNRHEKSLEQIRNDVLLSIKEDIFDE